MSGLWNDKEQASLAGPVGRKSKAQRSRWTSFLKLCQTARLSVVRNIPGVRSLSVSRPSPVPRAKFDDGSPRINHGAVDYATLAHGTPPEIVSHVTNVLIGMGLEIEKETEFKYRCIRPRKRKSCVKDRLGNQPSEAGSGVFTAFTTVGLATYNVISTHTPSSGTSPGHSSDVDSDSLLSDSSAGYALVDQLHLRTVPPQPIYGDPNLDKGEEVRFSVELMRICRLENMLSLDIRRLKGNLRSYKFLYDTLTERCFFSR